MTSPRFSRAVSNATFAIVGAGLVWRLARYLANWPLWGDEAYIAVSLLTRDFAGLTRPLEYYQIAPPGFLWAELGVIRLLGASERALRLVPFVCGIASLLLFWRLAAKTLDRRSALMAVAFFSISFYPIRHSNEVKPYAIDLWLGLIVTYLAMLALKRPESKRVWAGLILVSAIGVWLSYPLILVSGGVGFVLAWRVWRGRLGVATHAPSPPVEVHSRIRFCRSLAGGNQIFPSPLVGEGRVGGHAPARTIPLLLCSLFLIATLASWAAMYGLIARPQALAAPFLTQMETWENSFPPVQRPWELPWWLLKTHTGNMMAYPYGGNHFGSVLTTVLVVVGGIVVWRKNRDLLILLLAPLGPSLAAAALHRYPYGTSARIALYMAPAICLLAGQGLMAVIARRVPRRQARATLLGIATAFGLLAFGGAIFSVVVPYKDIDDPEIKQVVQAFASESSPGDRWLGFNGLITLPKVKALMLMPWLQHAAQFHFYVVRDAPVPVDWNPDPQTYIPTTHGRTLFLLHTFGYNRFPVDILKAHLDNLVNRLGSPEKRRFDIRKDEVVEGLLFSSPR